MTSIETECLCGSVAGEPVVQAYLPVVDEPATLQDFPPAFGGTDERVAW